MKYKNTWNGKADGTSFRVDLDLGFVWFFNHRKITDTKINKSKSCTIKQGLPKINALQISNLLGSQ